MMDLTEELIRSCSMAANGTEVIEYQGVEIDLSKPFERLTMLEAVKKYTGIDFLEFRGDLDKSIEVAKFLGIEYKSTDTWGDILNRAFEEKVEDKLVQPTFICDYPVEVSPLTNLCINSSADILSSCFDIFFICITTVCWFLTTSK